MPTTEYSFPTSKFDESFKRAFGDKRTKTITFDGHDARNKFLSQGINYGLEEGLLSYLGDEGDDQWTVMVYELTDKGREHLDISS